jgi:hypothetical protein
MGIADRETEADNAPYLTWLPWSSCVTRSTLPKIGSRHQSRMGSDPESYRSSQPPKGSRMRL